MRDYSLRHKISWAMAMIVILAFYIIRDGFIQAPLGVLFFFALNFQNKGKILFRWNAFYSLTALFWLFCLISMLWAIDTEHLLTHCRFLLLTYITSYLLFMCFQKDKNVDGLLKLLMFAGYLVSILVILRIGMGGLREVVAAGTRVDAGDVINENTWGMWCGTSININLYYIFYKKEIKWWSLLLIPATLALAVTASRKAFLMVGLGITLMFLLHQKKGRKQNILKKILRLLMAAAVAGGIVYAVSNLGLFSAVLGRFETLLSLFTGVGRVDGSSKARSTMILLGWRLFLQRPFEGFGIDNARLFTGAVLGQDYYLHNNFVELLADVGLVGFSLYYSLYLYAFYCFFKLRKYKDDEYTICLILLMIQLILEFAHVSYSGLKTYCGLILAYTEIRFLRRKARLTLRQQTGEGESG